MDAVSNKSIWTLVCCGGVQTEPGILESEFLAQENLLSLGLSSYAKSSKESLEKFKADKSVGDTWKDFVLKLSGVFGVDERLCWDILCNYLATEFRGTSDSLADLLKNETQVKPLIADIWHFYRAERLYLLQVLKEVITNHNNEDHENKAVFEKVFEKIDFEGKLKHELVEQFREVIKEKSPVTEILGSQLGAGIRKSWTHFNLREQSEVLQLILLYLHQTGEVLAGDWLSLANIFSSHHFGVKQLARLRAGEESEACQELGNTVIILESAILLQLLDLPGVAADPDNHQIFSGEKTQAIEKYVSGLGDLRPHGPVMLAWMLGQFIARGQAGLQASQRYGEAAIGAGSLEFLLSVLEGDYTAHSLVSDVLHSLVYGVMSALVQAFDPASMGLALDTHKIVVKLLAHKLIAGHFWKNPLGLSVYFDELKSRFPLEQSSFMEVCIALASASPSSCASLVTSLSSLTSITDKLDNVPSAALKPVSGSCYELTQPHFPYPGTQTVTVPVRSRGELLANGVAVRFSCEASGWQMMLAEVGHLASQLESGAGYVSPECLRRVTSVARLVAGVTRSEPSLCPQLGQVISALLGVADRFSQTPTPPLSLVAAVLDVMSHLASVSPAEAVARLARTSLLPRLAPDGDLRTGVVGLLLAGQETVSGEFPSLLSFLRLLTATADQDSSEGCIAFVLSEVLPHYSQWRYTSPRDRDTIASLALTAVLHHSSSEAGLRTMASDPGLARALLGIASTGDRVIQTLLEHQTSWELGRGTQLVEVVQLALSLLHKLLTEPEAGASVMSGPVGHAVRSPPAGARSHFLLTLAHYTYFHHRPELATAAIRLLASISRESGQVSVLACLGPAAPAVKDQLLSRLESSTEDIRLKMAIIELLVSCVESQPGLLQLLMDLQDGASSQESSSGCLAPVLRLLSFCNKETGPHWADLHLVIVRLIDSLWSRGRILASTHLKKQKEFWRDLAHPLTSEKSESQDNVKMMKIRAFILRVLSHELYTWSGNMSPELQSVVGKICDEKSTSLSTWCKVDTAPEATLADLSETEEDDKNTPLFLLSSWRAFILVLSKDSPSSLSPAACRTLFSVTTSVLSSLLAEAAPAPPPRLTVLLAETCVVMARRWQTKCTDNMAQWTSLTAALLGRLQCVWTATHPRARLAVLGLALSTLRMSDFKLDLATDGGVLTEWLDPVLSLMRIIFTELESVFSTTELKEGEFLRCPELVLALVTGLVSRLPDKVWLSGLHHHCSLQLLLSAAGACTRHAAAPSFVTAIINLLIEICSCLPGVSAVLLQDLARDLWLPLSDLKAGHEAAWAGVRHVALQLAGTLVRTGRRQGVAPAVTAVALLQDKIVADLLSPRQGLDHLARAASVTRLVWSLSEYVTAWQSDHSLSLASLYRGCCRLLHTTTALLMRPTLLTSLVTGSSSVEASPAQQRDRRVSSSCSEVDLDTILCPEAVAAQGQLLEISSGCLALLAALSPSLQSLLAGEALLDPDRWQPLLCPSFSPPSLDQDCDTPSYGLLLSLANVCVRAGGSRDSTRSPSPSRSAPSPLADKMSLVLELCLTVLMSQSVLSLATPTDNQRDKQLLRRELGAELGSIVDTWRRHLGHRGGRSPGPVRSAKSPAPLTSTPAPSRQAPPKSPGPPPSSPQSRCSNRDTDNFMKFVSALVSNVFK